MKIHDFIRKSRILNWIKFDRQDKASILDEKFPLEKLAKFREIFGGIFSQKRHISEFSKNLGDQKISKCRSSQK